ncbi:suppressor of loss of ypt1 [Terramyces sp. JEL0728]|nr:suppressor of loss of ypt1 [Terramyces sp. JEL0728]
MEHFMALSPLFTVFIYRIAFGVSHKLNVYYSLLTLTSGVVLVCATNIKFHWVGFTCTLISTLVFVVQNIISKKIFNEHAISSLHTEKLDKLNMLFYSAATSFVLMIPIWLYSDGKDLANAEAPSFKLVGLFLAKGVTHFSQSMFSFSILAMVSPITYSIASLCKRIFVITASIAYARDHVDFIQGIGIITTFVGLWMYQKAGKQVADAERQMKTLSQRRYSLPKFHNN